MLKRIAAAALVIVAVVVGLALTQPDTFRVQRSVVIAAPPARVFAYLNDFHRWPAWSPWEQLDPAMRRTYSGAAAGQGATYAFSGNHDVGEGRMQIVESTPAVLVAVRLHFYEPIDSEGDTRFELRPHGTGTEVTWTMSGDSPFLIRVMGVFSSMDSMVGPDFEEGLARLKTAAERDTPTPAPTPAQTRAP
ncbi:polyketide cyclase/dehydrase/lipid transport protein [Pseudoduganella lurida]|uniref:Polyketide cyclase/dehydrase/lipid transport protein n=1 Tax=Pseudoduganella lurida TaxID=1036180 RepID=A0A562RDK0_9BURK|nr:SRPBCC family protein [Pseudoduganella lurida]TWI66614.1 polyketide cyclase/dehydrase/lipid transport protein [Pseudoduganella lurida]